MGSGLALGNEPGRLADEADTRLAVIDVVSGQVSLTFGTMLSTLPQVQNKRLRGLAITSSKCSAPVPELPTIAESGLPGYEASLWYGFVGPAGLPAAVVQGLNTEIVKILKLRAVRERLASKGLEPQWNAPEEFRRLLVSDLDRWVTANLDVLPLRSFCSFASPR